MYSRIFLSRRKDYESVIDFRLKDVSFDVCINFKSATILRIISRLFFSFLL